MLEIQFTSKFKKDYKRIKKQGKSLEKLEVVLEMLAKEEVLPESLRDHSLGGTYREHRECHIEPDWLLIYRIDKTKLTLVATRTGSHSELFYT